ncbi:helix-turn-helix domain-containing protein [Paraburkholderia ferrariae]|uniref:helix-turn-helix domain-containing protein n=1 Tax=Paraburkholderia ferrariae TaxID=386056 RepID=UPI000483962F|nr:helix-turn-helix transcriptional regulator [Paraburkholderia ferrariae]
MKLDVADVAFHQRLGRLIERIDDGQFWNALVDVLRGIVQFDNWVAMIFSPADKPRVVAESPLQAGHDALFQGYLNGVYLLDPFYQFSLGTISAGLYRLDEVAPDHFRETEYFRRYFAVNVLEDEVQFLAPLTGGETVSLSMGSRRRFSSREIGTLCLCGAWILPLMRRAVPGAVAGEAVRTDRANVQSGRQEQFEQALHRRATAGLTAREIEVALMILAGHSSKNIARLLGISPATAKVHRSNLYRKLEISSQAMLFRLVIGEEAQG